MFRSIERRAFLAAATFSLAWIQTANATVTGSFDGPDPTFFVAPGTAVLLGEPGIPGGALTTTIDTTLEAGVPPVPAPDAPPIPPTDGGRRKVEVLFLTDTTGSMLPIGTNGLDDFQMAIAGGGGLLTSIETAATAAFVPEPIDISWGVAEYKDVVGFTPLPDGWAITTPFGSAAAAATGVASLTINDITDGGGGDPEEAGYSALVGAAELWSTPAGAGGLGGTDLGEAERIIIWTGDGTSHEAVANAFTYPTTFETLTALREQSIAVYPMNIGSAGGAIDGIGSLGLPQATTIAEATGGTITHFGGLATPATLALAIETGITGSPGPPPPGGDGAALLEINNITVRFDPADLGPWAISFVERDTLFPTPLYEFDFSYPTIPPPPLQFPVPWGSDGPFSYLDAWGFEAIAPLAPDTRMVTFELRVDGVLIDTIEVTLTNESNVIIPEPSTLALLWLGLLPLGLVGWRRRRG